MKKLILVMLLFLFVITGCESSKRDYTSVDEITKNVPDVFFLNKYYDEIEATKNEKNKVKEEIDKFYNKILKQLTLEDDEDLKNYVDWIINNSDVDNLRIEH